MPSIIDVHVVNDDQGDDDSDPDDNKDNNNSKLTKINSSFS